MNVSNFTPGNTRLRKLKRYSSSMIFRRKLIKKDSLLIYLFFWLLYAPPALVIWHKTSGSLLEISFVMLAGLGLVLLALYIKESFLDKRRAAHYPSHFERVKRVKPDPVSFDNVFKPNFGKVEIDLD